MLTLTWDIDMFEKLVPETKQGDEFEKHPLH